MARLQFGFRMMLARIGLDHHRCPYCESCLHQNLQRKWFLIEARKCAFCGLIFRYPTDNARNAATFYEHNYSERKVSDLPSREYLNRLTAVNFANSPFDKAHRVNFIRSICPGGKILDFGCSWGYGLYQLKQAGYQAIGFELAGSMAEYGRQHLGIDIYSSWESLDDSLNYSFDLIYTDHVLEHVANLRHPLERFAQLLKPSGLLLIFVPNAGGLLGRQHGVGWKAFLGEAHTIAFTHSWFSRNLPQHGFSIEKLSSSLDKPETLFDGEELACIARRNSAHHPDECSE